MTFGMVALITTLALLNCLPSQRRSRTIAFETFDLKRVSGIAVHTLADVCSLVDGHTYHESPVEAARFPSSDWAGCADLVFCVRFCDIVGGHRKRDGSERKENGCDFHIGCVGLMYGLEAIEEKKLSFEHACGFDNRQNEEFSNTYIPRHVNLDHLNKEYVEPGTAVYAS